MSSPSRVFAVLSLFTREHPVWHTDDINTTLGYTRATGYRYVKDLVQAGFLQKVSAGRYALGARIIELDHHLRRSDPVLLAAAPVMNTLATRSGHDVVLSTMFSGMKLIDTYRVGPQHTVQLRFGRGRPRPLSRGAAPRIIMAFTPRSQLKRIYAAHATEFGAAGMGQDWEEFRQRMNALRRKGMYVSLGEVEKDVAAAAVPLLNADGEVMAALSLVGTKSALEKESEQRLYEWLNQAAREIQRQLPA